MSVRIYQPAKSTMQSGRSSQQKRWLLEFEPSAPQQREPLMGWTASDDTRAQLRLWFDSAEEAVAYAQAEHLSYTLETPKPRQIKPKAYADNFRYDKVLRWTH